MTLLLKICLISRDDVAMFLFCSTRLENCSLLDLVNAKPTIVDKYFYKSKKNFIHNNLYLNYFIYVHTYYVNNINLRVCISVMTLIENLKKNLINKVYKRKNKKG